MGDCGDRVGIVAGGGPLPREVALACLQRGVGIFVIGIVGQTDDSTVAGLPHAWLTWGAFGELVRRLRNEGIRDVVFTGRVRRPDWRNIRPDAKGAGLLARLIARPLGDSDLIGVVFAAIEGEGFRLRAIEEVVAELLAGPGLMGKVTPDKQGRVDMQLGARIAKAIGAWDIGQAVVVRRRVTLAVEAAEGTDAMLRRCAELRDDRRGGVLVKMCKPDQDLRTDLPVIGPRTIAGALAAGLAGIAVEAGRSLVAARAETVALADRSDIFLYGCDAGQWDGSAALR